MKEEDFKDGGIYWTCRSSMESEEYGDHTPRKPHKVKAFNAFNDNVSRPIKIFLFDEETGKIGNNTNAYNYISLDNIYETEGEALQEYKELVTSRINDLANEIIALTIALNKELK